MGGWVSPLLRGVRLLGRGDVMVVTNDDDCLGESSFSDLLRDGDENVGDLITSLSTPDGGHELSESEILADDQYEPSYGSFSFVHGEQSLQDVTAAQPVATSSSSFDIDKHVRMALQSQPVQVPSGVWSSIFSDVDLTESMQLFGQELRRPMDLAGPGANRVDC